ncbi:TetR family transcriptional regulator [Sphaerisporangium rufum]|uniref:TetR family transcriptional regulator n=1 Tax=Sphaerisporangium rufum TaxID=1381558 RepID=A0A919R6Q2_9ACTN|nr:TetR family transcriptional regulator [Sphaerisporangium rufum]
MRRKGFTAAGVRDITAAAGVPQGSFTNHFTSKEAFGLEILDRYFADVRDLIAATLRAPDLPPLRRLAAYFDAVTARLAERGWHHGCLVGNMSLESAEHSEAIRARLAAIFAEWREPFAECLAQARERGELADGAAPDDLADFLLSSWQGAILRMKVERDPAPLERFTRVVFTGVLRPPPR